MPEYIDPETGEVYPMMEPADFEAYPSSFLDYTEENPTILPDYGNFAYGAFDLIDRRPDEHILLEGPHGIGKTQLLIPKLLEQGKIRGYKALGSVSMMSDWGGISIFPDLHESDFAIAKSNRQQSNESYQYYLPEKDSHRREFTERLRQRFEASGGRGLFVYDEPVNVERGLPWLQTFIFDEAKRNGITIASTQPVRDWGKSASYKEGAHNLQFFTKDPITRVRIREAKVTVPQIGFLLKALGIEASFATVFEKNGDLRRLRLVANITNDIIGARKKAEDDDFIWDTNFISRQLRIMHERERSLTPDDTYEDWQISENRWATQFGLSPGQVKKIQEQLTKKSDD